MQNSKPPLSELARELSAEQYSVSKIGLPAVIGAGHIRACERLFNRNKSGTA